MDCKGCGRKLTVAERAVKVEGWTGRKITVEQCKECGAISGTVYRGDFYTLIKPRWETRDTPIEDWRHYDFTVLGSDGVSRSHGWYDAQTYRIVQTG